MEIVTNGDKDYVMEDVKVIYKWLSVKVPSLLPLQLQDIVHAKIYVIQKGLLKNSPRKKKTNQESLNKHTAPHPTPWLSNFQVTGGHNNVLGKNRYTLILFLRSSPRTCCWSLLEIRASWSDLVCLSNLTQITGSIMQAFMHWSHLKASKFL